MNTYNFYADFEQDIFILKSRLKITEGDNLSRVFAFEFAKEIEVGEAVILKIKNSNIDNAKEVLLDFTGSTFEYALPMDILQVDGELVISLTKTRGDVIQTIAEFPDGIRVRKALNSGELEPQEVSITLQLIAKVTALEVDIVELKELVDEKASIADITSAVSTHNASATAHDSIKANAESRLRYRGVFTTATEKPDGLGAYVKNDVVSVNDGNYSVEFVSLIDNNSSTPVTTNAWWRKLASKSSNTTTVYVPLATQTTQPRETWHIPLIRSGNISANIVQDTRVSVRGGEVSDIRGYLAADKDLVPIWSALDHLNLNKTDETDFEEHKTSVEAHQDLFDMKANKENWRLIKADTITSPVTQLKFTVDAEGNHFRIKNIYMRQLGWFTDTATTTNGGIYYNTNTSNTNRAFFCQMGSQVGGTSYDRNLYIERLGHIYNPTLWYGTLNSTSGVQKTSLPTLLRLQDEAITSILIQLNTAVVTGSFEIWGLDL